MDRGPTQYSRSYMNCKRMIEALTKDGKKTATLHEIQDYLFTYIGGSYMTFKRYMPFLIRMGFIKKNEDGTYDLQSRGHADGDC